MLLCSLKGSISIIIVVEELTMDEKELIPITPRDVLVKLGTSAIAHLAGGVLLFVMTMGVRFRIPGIILSVGALILGSGALFSKDREDKKPGLIITCAGVLGMVIQFGIPILRPFAVFALGLGAIGLFASGIWKGISFLRGLRSRQ
jgi:hypothetical protein